MIEIRAVCSIIPTAELAFLSLHMYLHSKAETWLFDVFLKTANDGKIGFSKNGSDVFMLFQLLHKRQFN